MRFLILIFSLSAYAFNPPPYFDKAKCFNPNVFEYVVNQKIGNNIYGVVGSADSPHGIIYTLGPLREGDDMLMFYVKYINTKKVKLDNGFTVETQVWRQCTDKEMKQLKHEQLRQD